MFGASASVDTIFALASGIGRAALAVMRVSGPASSDLLARLAGRVPAARRVSLRTLHDGRGATLDRAIVVWLPGPGSYTGEDGFELHLHGGQAVLGGVIEALLKLGARPAEPGEFSRRAVVHGRMDLLEAEAVADLVAAETSLQRDQALRQMGGALGVVYAGWASRLLRLLAQQEALIDFPDEALPPEVELGIVAELVALGGEVSMHLDAASRSERLRDGLVFAVVGPPNSGKSTLVNALCQRDIAIVSPVAGTTRDVLEARVDLAGVLVTLLDTAGLRPTADLVEQEGVRRALARMSEADLVLALRAADAPGTTDWAVGDFALPEAADCVAVVTKMDLADGSGGFLIEGDALAVSVRTGAGMGDLVERLEAHATRLAGLTAGPVFTRARHRAALVEMKAHLVAGQETVWPELRGEELRLAVQALGRVTGAVGVEDMLDSVFGQFCIGK